MDKAIELFNGIFQYNYSIGHNDDNEFFAMLKAGISNLSSEEDQKMMYEYFRKNYIKIWLYNAEQEEENLNLEEEIIEAEKKFKEYWEDN